MQCVSIALSSRISHKEELVQMSRITEGKQSARLFEYVTAGTSLSCRLIRKSTQLAQDADGKV